VTEPAEHTEAEQADVAKLGRRIARIAIPAVGALAAEPLYGLADTAIVGRISPTALASLGVAYGVLTPLTWLFAFLEGTTVTRVARMRGAGDEEGQARTLADATALAVVMGLGLVVFVEIMARPLAWLLSARGEVLTGAVTYLRIGALGFPLLMLAMVGHGDLQGRDRTTRSLLIVGIANILNVILELWLVHGLGWGLRGSAWGTFIAQLVTAAIFVGLFLRRTKRSRPDWSRMIQVVRDGSRLVLRTLGIVGAFACATAAATRMGDTQAAAHQITNQLFNFLALTLDALALAGQVLVAESLGRNDRHGATHTIERLLRITAVFGAAVGLIVMAGSRWFPLLFTADRAVQNLAAHALVVLGIVCIPGAIAFLYDGIYQGTADYDYLVKGTLGALAVFLPLWLVIMVRPSLGLTTLWGALAIWMFARAFIQHRHFRNDGWLLAADRSAVRSP
jgi:putative MATE family efflux protein